MPNNSLKAAFSCLSLKKYNTTKNQITSAFLSLNFIPSFLSPKQCSYLSLTLFDLLFSE